MQHKLRPRTTERTRSSDGNLSPTHGASPGHAHHLLNRARTLSLFSVRALLLLLIALTFYLVAFPQGHASLRAALIVPSLLGASTPAFIQDNEAPIKHTTMTIYSSHGPIFLDIFAPIPSPSPLARSNGGILIIPGVGDNRSIPQLVSLLSALAHSGITTMAMTTPALINYTLSTSDGDATVLAFQKLASLPGVDAQKIGIISFSGGVLAATIAAADPRIRDHVTYVTSFGGYFDALGLLRTFGTRSISIDGHAQSWQPVPVPLQVFGNVLTNYLSPSDQLLVQEMLNALTQHTSLPTAQQVATLSRPARAIYHLLLGDQPARVDTNLAALTPAMRSALQQLSPATTLAHIHAPIFLLHDRNDDSIPVTESRAFNAALDRLHQPHDYIEFHIFDHVLPRSHPDFWQELDDGSHLFLILQHILLLSSS